MIVDELKADGIPKLIKEIRKLYGWTLLKMGEECDTSPNLLWAYEKGKVYPTVPNLVRILNAAGISMYIGERIDAEEEERLQGSEDESDMPLSVGLGEGALGQGVHEAQHKQSGCSEDSTVHGNGEGCCVCRSERGSEGRGMAYQPRVIDVEATGKRITELMKEKGFSVATLADCFGFTTVQPIYKWRNGRAMPTLDNLVILASIFDVKVDDILVTMEV